MLRSLLLSTSLLTVAGAALAADLPSRAAPAAFSAAPIFTWTGLYVGVNAGYAKSTQKTTDMDYWDFGGTNESSKSGFTGGAQIGYNWQMGALVLGLEADINGVQSNQTDIAYDSFHAKTSYLGTVRGRAGVAVDRALIYVTGGLAYGKINQSWGYSGDIDDFVSNKTRFGYTVGAGVEYALTQNVSVKLEGIYADLGKVTVTDTFGDGYRTRFENTATMLRAGVNYRF
jgi:outer membrane immunogenic protein